MSYKQKYLKYKYKYANLKGGVVDNVCLENINIYIDRTLRLFDRTIPIHQNFVASFLAFIKDGATYQTCIAAFNDLNTDDIRNVSNEWALFKEGPDTLPNILNEILIYLCYKQIMGYYYKDAISVLFELIWVIILLLIKLNWNLQKIKKLFDLATLIIISQFTIKNKDFDNIMFFYQYLDTFYYIQTKPDDIEFKEYLFELNKSNLENIILAMFRETNINDKLI